MSAEHTTEQDLPWLLDDNAHQPPPIAAAPSTAPEETQAADTLPADPTEYQDGAFTEAVDGEVVDNPPPPPGIPVRYLIPISAGALSLALVVTLVVWPVFQTNARVIITPDRQTVSMGTSFSLSVRKLFTQSLTLSQTVKTTGMAHQNASAGRGLITFYNALTSPQTIPAGTLITGADGVNVITDQDAYIPAGTLAVNGQVTVSAHTASTGGAANIPAGDIAGACCREYVFARNSQFAGGMVARDYPTPTQTDMSKADQDLQRTLQGSMASEANQQLSPGEAVVPPQCMSKTTSSHAPGQEASSVTVTLTSSCTAYTYNRAGLTARETTAFTQAIASQLGSGYALAGQLAEKVTDLRPPAAGNSTTTATVSLNGTCLYHFTGAEVAAMQQLIAGKSQAQATMLLLKTRGVRTAGIQIDNGKTTLPGNVEHIAVTVYERG